MPKRRNPQHWIKPQSKGKSKTTESFFKEVVLEHVSLEQLNEQKKHTKELLKFQWDYYSELAYQRQQIESKITLALSNGCISGFPIKSWQRGVRFKYSLHPLSTVGSLSDPGGRFNIGAISPQNVPQFAALYLGADKDTVLQETLGQTETGTPDIDSLQRALTNPASFTYVSVSGKIETIFDLRDPCRLTEFFNLIRNFEISSELKKRAKHLKISPIRVISSEQELLDSFLDTN